MKVMAGDLKRAQGSLMKVLRSDMDLKLAYRLRKIANKITAELNRLEKRRVGMVMKYGDKDKQGNTQVGPKKMPLFQSAMDKIHNEEIDLGGQLIPLALLEASGIKISPVDLNLLEKFIDHGVEGERIVKP